MSPTPQEQLRQARLAAGDAEYLRQLEAERAKARAEASQRAVDARRAREAKKAARKK